MAPPLLLRIAYRPHSWTPCVGRHADGQFFGDITGYKGEKPHTAAVVLHLFDHVGHHLRSDIRVDVERNAAGDVLVELMGGLRDVAFGDIAVRLFQVAAHGTLWGMVDESGDKHGGVDWVELYPQRLGFHEPWNGFYDT
jgi:hypothetical protein